MNAAWGGISGANEISMCISAGHKTTKNILARKAFTVSMADAAHVVECDYVGTASGNDVPDKLAKAGFHTSKSGSVDAPLIDELAMADAFDTIWPSHGSYPLTADIIPGILQGSQDMLDGRLPGQEPPWPMPCRKYTCDGVSFLY